MPPRKAAKKDTGRYIDEEAGDGESSSSSRKEHGETSQVTLQVEEDIGDEEDEEDDDESTVGNIGQKRRRRTEAGTNKAEMKKWRRLAIEEKEAITNEGGLVWRAARPLLASLTTKQRREASDTIRSILEKVEERLDKVLVPRTTHMPHASRNLAGASALSSSGSIAGSVMSWQVERGRKMMGEEGDDEEEEKQDEISVLELGGFSTDIALLETLLLPEATETVAMTRAVEEQERELESSKARLIDLKEDRERRVGERDKAGPELRARLESARKLLQQTGVPMLNQAEGRALREAASASIP